MSKYCIRCGKLLGEDFKYCIYCGTLINDKNNEGDSIKNIDPNTYNVKNMNCKKTVRIKNDRSVLYFCLSVLALLLSLIACWSSSLSFGCLGDKIKMVESFKTLPEKLINIIDFIKTQLVISCISYVISIFMIKFQKQLLLHKITISINIIVFFEIILQVMILLIG